ncbi:MAG: carnitine dehydratase, partial [Marmoricola sp.]|nr:carnitine dehydratase [Marmoricola sp.]
MQRFPMHIDGRPHEPLGGEWFETEDPFRGEPWAQVARGGAEDVDRAVTAAHTAFTSGPWPDLTATQRGALLRDLGDAVAAHAAELAETEVRDNGKLWAEMFGQLTYLPQWFHYYGGLADKLEGSVLPLDKVGYFAYTRKEPVGVTAIITPWNSPLLLLAWKLAPALATGCTVVIKPSEFTSASTLQLVGILEEAGLPPGVVNVVTGFGAEVGSPLVEHPLVRKISFTGSDTTGRVVNEQAARMLTHVSLELGGKSPTLVFEDADLESAVNGVVSGIFAATGQTCMAGSRLLVQESVHDEVVRRVVELAGTARMGDPREET